MAFVNKGINNQSFSFLKNSTQFKSGRASIPTSIDWRTLGYVNPIKNQGSCGSCWAFSAVDALEGQYFKNYGKLEHFSEQNLVDCTYDYSRNGCDGGWMDEAYIGIMNRGGIELNKTYPYESASSYV